MSTRRHFTACPLDCPDSCSLAVDISDNKITRIAASSFNPTTQGFICTKVSRFANRVYAKERILYPMKRVGEKGEGKFKRITWEEAVQTICGELRKIKEGWGGEAILPYSYGGSNGLLAQDTVDLAFFAKLGASRLARTLCAAPTTEAALGMYGKMPGTAFEDYEHAKLIVIWGANPKASNIHLVPYLKKAKSKGAYIVVVDPKLNFSRKEIDLHLPVYPGTDLVVALSMIDFWYQRKILNSKFIKRHTKGIEVLLEAAQQFPLAKAARIARIDPRMIEKLAKRYALTKPAVIRIGWGLERNRNGGQAAAAILALPAVMGKFGLVGSGYTLSNSSAYRVDPHALVAAPSWNTRIINMTRLGRVLLEESDPPIRGLFIYNCNPVATVPNQKAIIEGLQRQNLFTVVSEQVMTDTAKFADIVLPAVTFLEQHEIKNGYGTYATQYLSPAIIPVGEAKPNEEMFALLGRTMGWQEPAFRATTGDCLARAVKSMAAFEPPLDLNRLRNEKIAVPDFKGGNPIPFKNVMPWTPDGKINLTPENLGDWPYHFSPQKQTYPLALISPATEKTINSTLAEFNLPELYVLVHPSDAIHRGLEAGGEALVYNDLGVVAATVRISDKIRQGVVAMPKGAWRKSSQNGYTSTALVPDHVSSVGGGACFNDARVEVERA